MGRGQMVLEIGHGSGLSQVEPALDVDVEREPRPALRYRLCGVPFALRFRGNLGEERDEVKPGQLGSRLLPN